MTNQTNRNQQLSHPTNCACGCGGRYKAGDESYKVDAENVAGLKNPWSKKPTDEDLKICKLCWFEARNGHSQNCPNAV